jgi:hypothetical protein
MRYFLTVNASRPYIAGGLTFTFEPVQNRGGSWLGILSVDDESAASTLSSASLYGVEEITSERYDSLKKKLMGMPDALKGSPRPQRVRIPGAAAEAVRLVEPSGRTPGVGNPLIEARPKAAPVVESVSLQTTTAAPPVEPLLESPSDKPAKRYTAGMPR